METYPKSPVRCDNSTSNIKIKLIILYIYNWIMLVFVLIGESESIPWKYGQIKHIIEDEIPNEPKLENNRSFEFDFCCLSIIFNLLLLTAIIFQEKRSRLCLYLALGWNLYELELHVINMIIFLYDAYDTIVQSWTLMSFLIAGVFLTALHISLLIDCTFYYNELNDNENEIHNSEIESDIHKSNDQEQGDNINIQKNSKDEDIEDVIRQILLNNETKDFQKYVKIYKTLFDITNHNDNDVIGEEINSDFSNTEYDELSDYKSDIDADDSDSYFSNYDSGVPESINTFREDDFEEYVDGEKNNVSNTKENYITNTTYENKDHKNETKDLTSDEDDDEICESTINYYRQENDLISKSESSSCCDPKCECAKTDDDENNIEMD